MFIALSVSRRGGDPREICAADANGASGGWGGRNRRNPRRRLWRPGWESLHSEDHRPELRGQLVHTGVNLVNVEAEHALERAQLTSLSVTKFMSLIRTSRADLVVEPASDRSWDCTFDQTVARIPANATGTRGLLPGKGYTGRLGVMDACACVLESTSVQAPITSLLHKAEKRSSSANQRPRGHRFSDITHVKDGAG